MLKFINSDLIENTHIRFVLLFFIISTLGYYNDQLYKKNLYKNSHYLKDNYYKKLNINYFANVIIFFIIPRLFEIDNFVYSLVINFIGFFATFVAAFESSHIRWLFINVFVIIISQYIENS